jgi:hypothetical protein
MIGTIAALQGDPSSGFYELKVKTALISIPFNMPTSSIT